MGISLGCVPGKDFNLEQRVFYPMTKLLLETLQGKNTENKPKRPPVWMMRQAGRYLPEYREVRKKAGGFLEMCDTPELACEVTCQPIRRYGFDGAIIFADILLLPRALGQNVWFEPGVGPKLDTLKNPEAVETLDFSDIHKTLDPVYKALSLTRKEIPADTTLLGFCGAPWTVACYMLNGGGSKDWAEVRAFAYENPTAMAHMLERLALASADYLARQVKAGADAVQVFDSWAGAVPPELEQLLVTDPVVKLAKSFKEKCPETPLTLFSKNARTRVLENFAQTHKDLFACLALDEKKYLGWAVKNLTPDVAIQGNLDNALLLTNPGKIHKATTTMLDEAGPSGRYIVNLGHGVLKNTPPENVAAFVDCVKNWQQ